MTLTLDKTNVAKTYVTKGKTEFLLKYLKKKLYAKNDFLKKVKEKIYEEENGSDLVDVLFNKALQCKKSDEFEYVFLREISGYMKTTLFDQEVFDKGCKKGLLKVIKAYSESLDFTINSDIEKTLFELDLENLDKFANKILKTKTYSEIEDIINNVTYKI